MQCLLSILLVPENHKQMYPLGLPAFSLKTRSQNREAAICMQGYCMVQNFDGGKILTNGHLENFDEKNFDEFYNVNAHIY